MASKAALKVLLIGKGGREHALAWKLSLSPRVQHVYVVPGNGGTARGLQNVSNVVDTKPNDYPGLVELAKTLNIGLVVAGPDDAVVDGIEGFFRGTGIPCFAPTKEAARLEGSKTFAKDFMWKYGIPTAAYNNFTDYEAAKAYIQSPTTSLPVVIKVSGLAAGKGVLICSSQDEAQKGLKDIMIDGLFGDAGSSIVVEEYLEGDEISILTFSDGETTKNLSPGQDHKRIFDNDQGPNTGGMGVYAPVPMATPAVLQHIEDTILKPTFAGLKQEGLTFKGLLFTGIMLTSAGPKVLEYNVRFGDPETQSLLPLLSADSDLAEVMLASTERRLAEVPLTIMPKFACNVIVAAGGYPGSYAQDDMIEMGDMDEGTMVFHAGTKIQGNNVVTAGGRVLAVVGVSETLEGAVAKAYAGVQKIKFKNMFYRKDIARRALTK